MVHTTFISPVPQFRSDAVEASVPKLFWLSRCCRSIPDGTLAARRLPATQKTYITAGSRLSVLQVRTALSFRFGCAVQNLTTHSAFSHSGLVR
jgi:hypothetical protein